MKKFLLLLCIFSAVAANAVDLSTDMFKSWTADDATATADGTVSDCTYTLNTSTGCAYGHSNINHLHFADLSSYGNLTVTVSEGSPRFFFNVGYNSELTQNDKNVYNLTITADNTEYLTKSGNTYIINLAKIVADKGYAHLHAIKGKDYQSNVTVTSMELYTDAPVTPLQSQRRPIDNKHPMWLVHVDVWNNADPQKIIDLIPEDIKPYVVMNLSLSCQFDDELQIYKKPQNALQTYRSWASVCCRNNMFFTCQPASGGRTHIIDNDANFDNALEIHEQFFKDYPNFIGWNYAEQFWGFDENSNSSSKVVDRIKLFSKLVPMHKKYGGVLTISFCGNIWSHPVNPIGMMKRNSDFLNACKQYPESMLWLYKYTTSANWYNNESVSMGPFISGLSQNYGVRYDNCGWNGAIEEFTKSGNEFENDGLPTSYPGAVGIAPVLEQTALNGACVWDGPELIWTECFKNGNNTTVDGYSRRNWGTYPNFDNIWVDMFRKIIDGTIHIPSREEVLARTKVVIKNDISADNDATGLKINAYAAPIDLYHDLYWQDDPFNARTSDESGTTIAGYGNNNFLYFKKTGRYASIPVVIDLFDDKAKNAGITVINRSTYNSTYYNNSTAKVNLFNEKYPDAVISEGDLYVARHKNALVCYYPFSDRKKNDDGTTYKTTSYAKVPLKYNTATSMDLTFGVFSSAHVKEYSDHLDFYLNNYRADISEGVKTDIIKINGASTQPTYTVTSNRCNATVSATWQNNVYTVTVQHCGPLDLRINCAGSNSRSSLATVDDAALSASSIATPVAEDLKMQPLVIEGEDFDFKSTKKCVTDAYNDFEDWNNGNPTYTYRTVRGQAAMGFNDMGTSTSGSLRDNTVINNSGKYTIGVKYLSLAAGNIDVVVNNKTYNISVDKTGDDINESATWKTAELTAELVQGANSITINNTGGQRLLVDNVTFTPQSFYDVDVNGNKTLKDMYKTWDAATANANVTATPSCAYVIGESTGQPFGDGNVYYLNYADLSKYGTLAVTATAGAPRFLFNRDVDNGSAPGHLIEIPNNNDQTAAYQTIVDNGDGSETYYIDLAKMVDNYGYAHLNAIKGADYGNVTVSAIELTAPRPISCTIPANDSKTIGKAYFQVEGEGVTYDPVTGVVTSTQSGGKIFVTFDNLNFSYAKSVVLDVTTTGDYTDICGTGEIFNDGTSINTWYGSRYSMQNLDLEASKNNVAQGYIWNDKMGSVTKMQWNISTAGTMKINGLTLTATSANYELVDGTNYTNTTQKQYNTVTYTRMFSETNANKWNALCVPFAINVTDYSDQFDIAEIFSFSPVSDTNGNGYIDETDDVKLILSKKQSGTTKPGKPYLIRPKTAGTLTITAADGVLYPATPSYVQCYTTKTIYTITGLYSSIEATPQNNYYYVTGDGMIGHRTTTSATLKANRWYMSLTSNNNYDDSSPASAKASYGIYVIGEDLDETTALRLINGNTTADNEAIYTLQGVKVSSENQLPSGIYIKNGRKFIIK